MEQMLLLLFLYIFLLMLMIETFAYFWHRYVAHTDYIPIIHDVHKIHHELNLNTCHEANEDFIWLLLILIIGELMAGFIIMLNIISDIYVLTSVIFSIFIFWWNWYIHTAYHQEHHWLNSYEWFKEDKRLHYLHHYYPNKNYSIATHFNDILFGSYIRCDPIE